MGDMIRMPAAAAVAAALALAGPSAAQAQMAAELLASNCFACHGPQGLSSGDIPKLSDLTAANIAEKFRAFKEEKALNTIMTRIAKGYTDEQIGVISAYIEKLNKSR